MNFPSDLNNVIEIRDLRRRFGNQDALDGLSLSVPRGSCYGFFGRNGAGKTTTIKCLLNLLRPDSGRVSVFGLDPAEHEVRVKERLAYVPDQISFYPWMSVGEALAYARSFRKRWNPDRERDLLARFGLELRQPVAGLSKGQRTQAGLIIAIAAEPELLVLDEPTSGLDPVVRRELIETVIGTYLEGDPDHRTVFVSTHLIAEFEGLIDRFTVVEHGRAILTLDTEETRAKFRRIQARFPEAIPSLRLPGTLHQRLSGRDVSIVANGSSDAVMTELRRLGATEVTSQGLTLEEVFVAVCQNRSGAGSTADA